MVTLTVRPATILDAFDMAGYRPMARRVLAYQVRRYQAEVVEAQGVKLALVMLCWHRRRRAELAISFQPPAARHMRDLLRLAHLTLSRFVQDGVMVYAHIRASDARAQRMARLAGFRPGRLADRTIWVGRP